MHILVYHSGYGCDTGCCGHTVELDDGAVKSKFFFDHPDQDDDLMAWAKDLVEQAFGKEHVADLDWDECEIIGYDDCSNW